MKILQCDCDASTRCPQGRVGTQEKCRIWKLDQPETGTKLLLALFWILVVGMALLGSLYAYLSGLRMM